MLVAEISLPGFSTDTVTDQLSGAGAKQLFLLTPFGLLLSALVILVIAVIIIMQLRRYFRWHSRTPQSLEMTVLRVTVPQNANDPESKQRQTRELLARAEDLYVGLGAIKPYRYANVFRNAWNTFWYGRGDHIALELVMQSGVISLYVVTPAHLRQYVEQQLHSQYKLAHVEEVPDYNIFTPHGKVFGGYLGLRKRSMFPVRTYQKFEHDPLDAILTALSRLPRDQAAAIQVLIRPAGDRWQHMPLRVARSIQHGKTVNQALEETGGSFIGGVFKTVSEQAFGHRPSPRQMYEQSSPRFLTPLEQELVKSLEMKASKSGFATNIRIVTAAPTLETARQAFINIFTAFGQYQSPESGNAFRKRVTVRRNAFIRDFIHRHFHEGNAFVFNTEELMSVFHLPLPDSPVPNLRWLTARRVAAPTDMVSDGIILGRSVFRGQTHEVRLGDDDRRRHMYIIGTTGTGKSALMQEMVKQDIAAGHGVCVIDPHGSLVENVMGTIPRERANDVIYFDPSDVEQPIGLNMLEADTPEEADFAIQEMIAIFYKLFPAEMIGPMFEHNMRNAMLTLIADRRHPGTIIDIPRMFTDRAFQREKVRNVTDPIVKSFWEKEMSQTSDFHKSEMLGYLISKVGRFVENQMMRNIIGQSRSGFQFREIMDQKKILLINLSKGKTGEVNSSLLGLIVVSKLQMAALRRADMPESQRTDFYCYIDEFQNFVTDSIATILSEARKYRLNLILAHQYISQLVQHNDTKIRDAVLGNVGSMVAFRVGVEDAPLLAKQFEPVVSESDLINIEKFNAYAKLLINNSVTPAFTMQTNPPSYSDPMVAAAIRQHSREKYGRPRASVEQEILERSQLAHLGGTPPPPPARV